MPRPTQWTAKPMSARKIKWDDNGLNTPMMVEAHGSGITSLLPSPLMPDGTIFDRVLSLKCSQVTRGHDPYACSHTQRAIEVYPSGMILNSHDFRIDERRMDGAVRILIPLPSMFQHTPLAMAVDLVTLRSRGIKGVVEATLPVLDADGEYSGKYVDIGFLHRTDTLGTLRDVALDRIRTVLFGDEVHLDFRCERCASVYNFSYYKKIDAAALYSIFLTSRSLCSFCVSMKNTSELALHSISVI